MWRRFTISIVYTFLHTWLLLAHSSPRYRELIAALFYGPLSLAGRFCDRPAMRICSFTRQKKATVFHSRRPCGWWQVTLPRTTNISYLLIYWFIDLLFYWLIDWFIYLFIMPKQHIILQLGMWTNAQRDGRPAEYRWRTLFNAAVWLTPTTRVPCSNAAKTRNPLKFGKNIMSASATQGGHKN